MKTVVLYDSVFGNTEKVAKAMAEAMDGDVTTMHVDHADLDVVAAADVLVVGSPTRAFNPTPAIKNLLKAMPSLKGKKAKVFDTRSDKADVNSKAFNFFEKRFGYAAEKMARALKRKGADVADDMAGFFVADSEGPMKAGEISRAKAWVIK